ncbi:MAG: histidine kinase dimerization/phospho-acceptor domain-containing protein, partial [Verrucomicrobiia bacterium]
MVNRKAPTLVLLLRVAMAWSGMVILSGSEAASSADASEAASEEARSKNHVLLLPGNGGFAELPMEPFKGLTNATIECWVRWDELVSARQAFNFGDALRGMRGVRRVFNYGSPWRDVSILSTEGNGLGLVVADEKRNLNWLRVPDVLMGGEWCHIAAVIGNGEMQLYLNGFPLQPPQKCTGSFATADSNGRCYLGKSVTESDSEPTMAGAIDEFRVWNHLRGPDAIRRDMFRRVQESEPGLVWFADFEPEPEETDGTLKGVKLEGGARLVVENLPKAEESHQAPPRFGPRMAPGGPGGSGGFGGSGWRGRSPPLGFLTGLLSAFCVMHALLFAFQPAARNHLYFALISGLAAGMTWPGSERSGIGIHWLALLAVLTLRLFQSLFEPEGSEPREKGQEPGQESGEEYGRNLYRHFVGSGHRRFRTMVLGALIVCAVGVIDKNVMSLGLAMEVARLIALVILIRAALLILRIAWGSWRQKREGARLIGLGLGALLVLSEIPAPIPRIGGLTFGQLGVVIFFCAMSVHLAKTFAMANRRLALQAAELNESNARLRQANEAIEQQKHDLAEAKAAAEAANEAKSRFLASVSHELRTPLNAIIGYSEMLQEIATEDGNHQYLSDLQKIHAAAHHQLTLINDILDLSKVEAGKMTVLAEEFDVAELVNDVVSTVQPLIAKGEARLSVH